MVTSSLTRVKIKVRNLSVSYGDVVSLKNVSLDIKANSIISIIGPSNSGKTTFLKTLNRMVDHVDDVKVTGSLFIDEKDIYRDYPEDILRRNVGIIFALPVPLPMSVFDNVIYGPRRHGIWKRARLNAIAEKALKDAYLWEEVKDRLAESAMKLSGGQQQRMCIARTLAVNPEILLFDEPCSGLDPISTAKVEEAMLNLKEKYTIVLVTNNTKQAARVSDETAFFLMGELVEMDLTSKIFTAPRDQRTDDYISGRFG